MARTSFKFSNLCGTVYKGGSLCFTPDGNTLLSPVGNRVTAFQLVAHSSTTLDFEARSDIDRVVVSPDGRLLLVIDVDGRALAVNLARNVVVHRFNAKERVQGAAFSPDGRFIALSHGRKLLVWRTPSLEREFSPFVLHRSYTGHYEDLTCIDWAPNGAYLVTGSKDLSARIHSLDPVPGFIPVTLGGHRERVVSVHWAAADTIYTVSRDGAVFVWVWTERPEITSQAALAALRRRARAAGGEGEGEEEEATGEGEGNSDEGGEGVEGSAGAAAAPQRAPRRKRRRGEGVGYGEGGGARTSNFGVSDDDELAWNPAARMKAHGTVSALASRVRHTVPAPHAAGGVGTEGQALDPLSVARGEWVLQAKHLLRADGHARVTSAAMHVGGSSEGSSSMLIIGFSSGVFSLYALPDFAVIHSLSISSHEVHACAVNAGGAWIAFGSATLGQLLVWEWASETYILKQQGHFYDLNAAAYSPNGQLVATGGDDGKVKVWNTATGFCFVTFAEHSAPVSAVTFVGGRGGGHGLAVLSASLDGTVRAFDLVRYRNFRTLTAPPSGPPVQFACLAADEAGEVVAAGGMDPFNIYVWSLQTGRILDVLSGHEAPVVALSYSPAAGLLASGSWDKTVRLWDIYKGTATESLTHGADVLAVAFRPDGAQLAAATLSGTIALWDVKRSVQTGTIDGRRDIAGGRRAGDLVSAKASSASKHFSALAYSADGDTLLAGGRSKWVCLYAVTPRILLRRFQVTHNRSIDGVLDKLNSRNLGEGGVNLTTLDLAEEEAEGARRGMEEDAGGGLPGVQKRGRGGGNAFKRSAAPEVRTKCAVFSPSGRAFGVATTEGLLLYALDDALSFDPIELGEDTTPEAVASASAAGAHARALLIALHLGEPRLISAALGAAPMSAIPLIAATVPLAFLDRLLSHVAARLAPVVGGGGGSGGGVGGAAALAGSRHVEFFLAWALALLQAHARALKERPGFFAGTLRAMQRALLAQRDGVGRLAESNRYALAFLSTAAAAVVGGGGGGAGAPAIGGVSVSIDEELDESSADDESVEWEGPTGLIA